MFFLHKKEFPHFVEEYRRFIPPKISVSKYREKTLTHDETEPVRERRGVHLDSGEEEVPDEQTGDMTYQAAAVEVSELLQEGIDDEGGRQEGDGHEHADRIHGVHAYTLFFAFREAEDREYRPLRGDGFETIVAGEERVAAGAHDSARAEKPEDVGGLPLRLEVVEEAALEGAVVGDLVGGVVEENARTAVDWGRAEGVEQRVVRGLAGHLA